MAVREGATATADTTKKPNCTVSAAAMITRLWKGKSNFIRLFCFF